MANGSTDSNDSFDSKASGETRVGSTVISVNLLVDLDRFVDSRVTSIECSVLLVECLVLLVEWAEYLVSLVECLALLAACLVSLVECSVSRLVSRFESL